MALVRYLMLGPVAALVDGRTVDLGGPRQRGVLVVLLTHAGGVVPATRIIDAIWGDEPPDSAANLLQRSISQLRKQSAAKRSRHEAPATWPGSSRTRSTCTSSSGSCGR